MAATDKSKETVFVIAGSHEEFLEWCAENGVAATEIKSSPSAMRGVRNVRVVRYGTWWTNPAARSPMLKCIEEPL